MGLMRCSGDVAQCSVDPGDFTGAVQGPQWLMVIASSLAIVAAAGFKIDRLETGYMPGPRMLTFLYEGSARPDRDGNSVRGQ